MKLNRRDFLVGSITVGGTSLAGCATIVSPIRLNCDEFPNHNACPVLTISWPENRLFINLYTHNLELMNVFGRYSLRHVDPDSQAHLVYEFPPQHFSETTIDFNSVSGGVVPEAELERIELFASGPSKIAFVLPPGDKPISVTMRDLLDWERLSKHYLTLEKLAEQASLSDDQLGFDWFANDKRMVTSIEMPWGVYLQPLDLVLDQIEWKHSGDRSFRGDWLELWYTSLESKLGRELPVPMEILDVAGLRQSHVQIPPPISFEDVPGYPSGIEDSPLRNRDRLDLITSLSRRFPYQDELKVQYLSQINGQVCTYGERDRCYLPGNVVEAYRFGLSAYGGMLDLKGEWDPDPPCSLQSWTHRTNLGRDTLVKIEHKGWLYPLGVPAVLVIQSERQFLRDKFDHFVAPLIKFAFLRIPQPNEVAASHSETPFPSFSVTTVKTPPLDVPSGGSASDYADCIYFLPTIENSPFEFEITSKDYADNRITSRMPCYFVSNRGLDRMGLICEPGYADCPDSCTPEDASSQIGDLPQCPIPLQESEIDCAACWTEQGLWALDALWMSKSLRFALYDNQSVAVAPAQREGNTTHEVGWIEWTRGRQPELVSDNGNDRNTGLKAPRPFEPRARTMKLSLQNMRQFSGQGTSVLVSYRDLSNECLPTIDPQPAGNDEYFNSLLNSGAPANEPGAYLQVLPMPGPSGNLECESWPNSGPNARPQGRNVAPRLNAVIDRYYHLTAEPTKLLRLLLDLDNEIRFGFDNSTEGLGGLPAPDSYVNFLTQKFGPIGNNKLDPHARQFNQCAAENVFNVYFHSPIRIAPLNVYESPPINCEPDSVANIDPEIVNLPMPKQGGHLPVAGGGSASSLFGIDAQILPGISLTDVLALADIDLGGLGLLSEDTVETIDDLASGSGKVEPVQWEYRVTGLGPLLQLFGEGPRQFTPRDWAAFAQSPVVEAPEPVTFGIEASLNWSTTGLNDVNLGIIEFIANKYKSNEHSTFVIEASSALSFSTGKTSLAANAAISDFAIRILKSIVVDFRSITCTVEAGGDKSLVPAIGLVYFEGSLAFINNLQSLLKDLEDSIGLRIEISPERIEIGQVIAFPPSAPGTAQQSLVVGPAIITNLNFNWGVILPLLGREELMVYFGLASREEPLTISVPPYGGMAHALIEATTRGVRLFEVSVEYGGVISVSYSIASGQVSLTAGIFFQIKNVAGEKTTTITAYVKVVGKLIVARIITFNGLIQISLGYTSGSGGNELRGQARVKVSIKIGFVRISYSFSAEHVEKRKGDSSNPIASSIRGLSSPVALVGTIGALSAARIDYIESTEEKYSGNYRPFSIEPERWIEFIEGYVDAS